MDFFTGGRIIMYYGFIFCFCKKCHLSLHKALTAGLDLCGLFVD